ncbi:MAG: hypothetical protein ACYCOU_05240, partial [Sulfobacillus sp.]
TRLHMRSSISLSLHFSNLIYMGKFHLALTRSAVSRSMSGAVQDDLEQYQDAISPDGSQIFTAHIATGPTRQGWTFAELMTRDLTRISAIAADQTFSVPTAGAASKDFTRFALLDINPTSSGILGQGRLRLFDMQTFTQIGTDLIFDDVNVATDSLNLGQFPFSPDNRFLVINYINGTDPMNLTGVMKTVDLSTTPFSIADSQPCGGFDNGSSVFSFNGNWYVVTSPFGAQGENFFSLSFVPPYQLQVWSLSPSGGLSLVDQQLLPNLAIAVLPSPGKPPKLENSESELPIIAAAISNNVLPGRPTLLPNVPPSATNSEDGLQLFSFDGKRLELILGKNYYNGINGIAWHSDGRHLAVAAQGATFNLTEWSPQPPPGAGYNVAMASVVLVYELERRHGRLTLRATDNTIDTGGLPTMCFSADGNWFYVGNGYGLPMGTNVNNELVFKVTR